MKRRKYLMIWCTAVAVFFAGVGVAAVRGGTQAKKVSDSVLRFHIVANSNSEADQELKMKVRDGIAGLTSELFADADSKSEAIAVASTHTEELENAARSVLQQNGCDDSVRVQVKNLYFPTKTYENITFPAGYYDAIHIEIGEGKGENFWCVMFPALCIPSVSESNEDKLSVVLEDSEVDFVTHPYTLKFKAAEWLGKFAKVFKK